MTTRRLTAAEAVLRGAGWEDASAARAAVPRQGLAAPWRMARCATFSCRSWSDRQGRTARARARLNPAGADERVYLEPLEAIAPALRPRRSIGCTLHGAWQGDVRHIFAEAAICLTTWIAIAFGEGSDAAGLLNRSGGVLLRAVPGDRCTRSLLIRR